MRNIFVYLIVTPLLISFGAKSELLLSINGKLIEINKSDYTRSNVELYKNDSLIAIKKCDNTANFNFILSENNNYVVKVKCKGYLTKCIQFNTIKSSEYSGNLNFDFSVEMLKCNPKIFNDEVLIGKVYFDDSHKKFVYDKKYTSMKIEELTNLKIKK